MTHNLPEFVPFEELFPDWSEASETLVESAVPEIFKFRAGGDGVIVDWTWAVSMLDKAPERIGDNPHAKLSERMEMIQQKTSEMIASGNFLWAINRIVTEALLCNLNTEVERLDRMRLTNGEPTWKKSVLNLLGISPLNPRIRFISRLRNPDIFT